jgi:sugar/nucleoside kinase (ribokinase family)
MSDPDILCAGIVVADHVCTPISHVPAAGELVKADGMLLTIGGCAANAAVDLAKMDVRAAVVGRVGNDTFGSVVTTMLRAANVDTAYLRTTPDADTSQTLIVNVRGQDRRFIHTFGANAKFSARDLPREKLARGKILYVGGYLVMPDLKRDELAEVFAEARALGMKTVLDVVVPGPGDYLGEFENLLTHTDVFLPNQDEGEIISGQRDPLAQAEIFRRLGAKTVVITMGGSGSIWVDERVRLKAGVFSVPLVDGAGGGDAFAAGLMIGLLRNLPAEECLQLGSALGASCVRAIGTTPGVFTRAECEEFLRANRLRIEFI